MKRFILSLALLLPLCSQAQQAHHELGLIGGVANYYGDLNDDIFTDNGDTYRAMGGVLYKYFMSPHVGIRLGLTYSKITAADSLSDALVRQQRNLSFTSDLFEFHTALELNLLPVDIGRAHFSPYVFAGLGVFYYNPYTMGRRGEKVFLRPMSTEGQGVPMYPDRKEYSLVNVSFPIGGGFKFFVGETFVINTEIGFRYTNTDYLDDVSKSYVNLDTLQAYRGKQAVDMSYRGNEVLTWDGNYPNYKYQRGDSKANDWYWFGGISISVYLDAMGNIKDYWQTHCPSFLRPGKMR